MTVNEATARLIKLEPESEIRFELEGEDAKITLRLNTGFAEIFGTELVKKKKYKFTSGANFAVYTWQGCTLELTGTQQGEYISKVTPMNEYLNCHAVIEEKRQLAERKNSKGPVIMIAGPYGSGKSTTCKLLLNYAIRSGRRPLYVDLDVEQNTIAIPGTMGALILEKTADIVYGFNKQAALVFHFGSKSPTTNIQLYNLLVTRLAEVCSDRMQANKKCKTSGIIIKTSGLIKGDGYKMLTHAAQAFEVDAILVLGQEKLKNDLRIDMPQFVKVTLIPKSGGVVDRTEEQKIENYEKAIREYFYGSEISMQPFSLEVKWSDIKIFQIGDPKLPSSCLPVGSMEKEKLIKPFPVVPGPNLLHHILAVSSASSLEVDFALKNVYGFLCVTNVDIERETFTVLCPQRSILPDHILLLSDVQFMDSH